MATYAIGDIQGCYAELRALLGELNFNEAKDTLWLVGDLVNRGPGNVETLDYLMALPNLVTVLGNHDLHFLAVARTERSPSRSDTLDDLLNSPGCNDIIDWLRMQPLMHVDTDSGFVMVHAGIPPIWDLATARKRAGEVEAVLQGDEYTAFLQEMYGNEPATWQDDLAGIARLRLITNYFTRMRFCTSTGDLELLSKTEVQPEGYAPWFTFPRQDSQPYKLLFGHWAAIAGETNDADTIGLDTGCVWGRALTALCLETGETVSVSSTTA